MLTEPYLAPAAPRQFIDLAPDPFVFHGWIVEYQQANDDTNVLAWDATRLELYIDDAQKNNDITGNTIREKLKGKPVLNADVLDFLLRNPELIPEDWKKKDKGGNARRIFFLGHHLQPSK